MPTITKTFGYFTDGNNVSDGFGLHQAIIPAGASSVTFHIWGGGGGGGGGDRAGPGRSGSAGHYVTGTINLTSHVGSTLTLGVGGGAGGKSMGKGLTGYSGGIGGTSGPSGSSGSGGGGGGATVIRIGATDMAIAGGGGGGGGDGLNSVGTDGINSNDPTLAVPGTLGENGADHSGDGAGAGAGGGGADGGRSGNGPGGDDGATGGYAGSNLVPAGGTQNNGSGTVPYTGGDYQTGIAIGGTPGSAGGNGLAILVFDISVEAKVKISNSWKSITAMKFKKSGVWKDITAAYVKINGVWKAIFNSGINFVGNAAGFGDTTGNPSSGTPGSGGTGGGGGGGCSIICTKLHELGYLSDEIYQADEMFGQWLRQTDPDAYYGYLKWARVVVDWMSNEGPQCMFWIQDKIERNASQKDMAVRWAKRIATPWAQHMAYKMGVLKEDNRAGRYIMNIGIAVSRVIGKFVKHTNQPTKNVAIGYAMWAMFGLLYMIAGVK
jgi:hypothetical protein